MATRGTCHSDSSRSSGHAKSKVTALSPDLSQFPRPPRCTVCSVLVASETPSLSTAHQNPKCNKGFHEDLENIDSWCEEIGEVPSNRLLPE
jgi:hypothetical protein